MAENTAKKPGFFAKVKNWFKGIGKFFRDTKSELKKVVWPSKSQIINNSIVVRRGHASGAAGRCKLVSGRILKSGRE